MKSNDKKRAGLEAMRHVLSLFDYDNEDHDIVGTPDANIVGSAAHVYERGENVGIIA